MVPADEQEPLYVYTAGESWTHDLPYVNKLLYPLSYSRIAET